MSRRAVGFLSMKKHKILTSEEVNELIKKIQADPDDERSKTKLIESTHKYVVFVARQYMNRGLEIDDLISEGTLGMMKAISKFDTSMNVKFTTYATWWIKDSIIKSLYDAKTVSIPVNKITLVTKFKRALEKNSGDYEKTISDVAFAEYRNEMPYLLEKVNMVSLDTPIGDEGDSKSTIMDTLVAVTDVNHDTTIREIFETRSEEVLSEREQTIITLCFGIGTKQHTYEETGKVVSLSSERVRQLRQVALKKLVKDAKIRKELFPIWKK